MSEDLLSFVDDSVEELEDIDALAALEDDQIGKEVSVVSEQIALDIPTEQFNEEQARHITEAIRSAATATYLLLTEAYNKKAHLAMGYDSWSAYVKGEFDMSASRSYQLLDLGKTVKMIEGASPEGTDVKLTEAQARDIKRELPRITERVEEETYGMSPEEASERVKEIIAQEREVKKAEEKAKKEKEQALAQAEEDGYHRGLEAAADALLEQADGDAQKLDDGVVEFKPQEPTPEVEVANADAGMRIYNFLNLSSSVDTIGEPYDFVQTIPSDKFGEFYDIAKKLNSWFRELVSAMEEK